MLNLEYVFFPVYSRIKLLVRHVQVHLGRAGSHKVWVAVLSKSWAAAFLLRILAYVMARLIRYVHVHFDGAGLHNVGPGPGIHLLHSIFPVFFCVK